MNTTPTPPELTPQQTAALLLHPDALALLDLRTSLIAVTTDAGPDIWESPHLLVLATYDDAIRAARFAVTERDLLLGVTAHLNGELLMLHEAGEIPTEDEVRQVLAEMANLEAEVVDLAARRAR